MGRRDAPIAAAAAAAAPTPDRACRAVADAMSPHKVRLEVVDVGGRSEGEGGDDDNGGHLTNPTRQRRQHLARRRRDLRFDDSATIEAVGSGDDVDGDDAVVALRAR